MNKLNHIKTPKFLSRLLLIVFGSVYLIVLEAVKAVEKEEFSQNKILKKSSFPPIVTFDRNLKSKEKELFNRDKVQTIRINFSHRDPDWFPQLHDIFKTGDTILGTLAFGDNLFTNAGVRFKGSSSYYFTPYEGKKSYDITLDTTENKERLFRNRKLNLNNGFLDPTMVREMLYLWICRHYVPTGKASYMHLIINDESWGAYTSVQQIDTAFFQEWFDNKGNRWRGILSRDGYSKVPKTFNISQPFTWQGPQVENYYGFYELRRKANDDAWLNLIEVCRQLQMYSSTEIEMKFDSVFAVDNALWMIALQNIFMDNDSFLRKGYDYYIYEEPTHQRMYLIQHDGNESFGTGVKGQWPKNVSFELDPFYQATNSNFPLIKRLLEVPSFRQRYLAHMRTIIHEWLNWDILEPVINRLQDQIEHTFKNAKIPPLHPIEQFRQNVYQDWSYKFRPSSETAVNIPGLKPFIQNRRKYLLNHPDISKPAPKIKLVDIINSRPNEYIVYSNQNAKIKVEIEAGIKASEVFLHFTNSPYAPFRKLSMLDVGIQDDNTQEDNIYFVNLPNFRAGDKVFFYIEARADDKDLTTSFSPPRAEYEFYSYSVKPQLGSKKKVVINEVKSSDGIRASNSNRKQSDWIELLNISENTVDLSGCFLSDDENNPRKWSFPKGTVLFPGKHLIVWADGSKNSETGLHVNFKISKKGETLILLDTDLNMNYVMDRVDIIRIDVSNRSFGRFPNGLGKFQKIIPTLGFPNKKQ